MSEKETRAETYGLIALALVIMTVFAGSVICVRLDQLDERNRVIYAKEITK